MKIFVIGGTGLIGSKLVTKLRAAGHEALAASPNTGVNIITGEGLAEAMQGATVVVDVANAPSWSDEEVMNFFTTAARNILAAEAAAGVGHHVALSVVGTEKMQDSGYFRAKLAQEEAIKAGSIPWTILRATQFFEFMDTAVAENADEKTVRLPATLIQPMASADVARAVADVSVGNPLEGTRTVAGPEVFQLDELGRVTLAAHGDKRTVVTDNSAGMFAPASGDALIAKGDTVIAPTTYREWLKR